jgi:pimeloyl-ACP methyl ester carboxylesterase/DNA-binding SARP family transcriptional activator
VKAASFRLSVLGPLEVTVEGAPAALPKSRKTRALLAYLALAGRPVRRERLCELLWDAPDDPRGALRWSLSKLRPIVNAGEVERLASSAEEVAWTGAREVVDLHAVEAALEHGEGALSPATLAELAAAFRGDLLDGLAMPEHDAFERWRLAECERVRQLRVRILRALVDRLSDSPADALAHASVLAEVEPYDGAARASLVSLHRRLGREKEARQAYEAGARALKEIGRSTATLDAAWRGTAPDAPRAAAVTAAAPRPGATMPPLAQDIRFCRAGDGARIAYAVVGQGPPLVKTSNWLNHLEYDWESPVWRHIFRAFAERFTFIRYDSRGNGLSDWDAEDLSTDALVADLEAVVEATGLDRFPLLGISQGCSTAIAYAVRFPERVSKLVLYGGFARGWRLGTTPEYVAENEAMATLMRTGWGRNNPAFRQIFTSFFIPDASLEQMTWFNELQRISANGENAARLMSAFGMIDVSDQLAMVQTPTIVLHVRQDARVGFARGREMAAGIPGARFVPLEGRNHLILEQEPAWPRFLDEVTRFLAEP